MDKLAGYFPLRQLKLTLVTLLAMFLFIGVSSAADIDWSFADHPHPEPHQLSVEEKAAIKNFRSSKVPIMNYCKKSAQIDFEIYNSHYPQFVKTGDVHARFLAWRYYVAARPIWSGNFCVLSQAFTKAVNSAPAIIKSGLIFCGVYSRQPQTPEEKLFVDNLNELVDFAGFGNPHPVSDLLAFNLLKPLIYLNPDVEYFLRQSLKQYGQRKNDMETSHVEPQLSRERIKFIDQAVKRRDLKAVLQSTGPCAPQ